MIFPPVFSVILVHFPTARAVHSTYYIIVYLLAWYIVYLLMLEQAGADPMPIFPLS